MVETLRLLRALRRRIWRRRAARSALPAAWIAALACLVSGAYHVWVAPHSMTVAAGLVAIVMATFAVHIAVFVRPTMAEAAREADVVFGGEDLMISAYDQLVREASGRSLGAPLVFAQAEAAARAWCGRLQTLPRASRLGSAYIPLALILAGFAMHSMPGATRAATTSATRGSHPAAIVARTASTSALADLSVWSRPLGAERASTDRHTRREATDASMRGPAVERRDASRGPRDEGDLSRQREETVPVEGGVAGRNGAGATPGGAARNPDAHDGKRATPVLPTAHVDIARVGDADERSAGSVPLDDRLESVFVPHGESDAVAIPVVAHAWRSGRGPALRAYLAAYARQLGGTE
jgi:hypothetical protein